tara:strand:+ start:2323 stop:4032 length:1710 start_codon:yes stop_codon:yes gene_type:complete
MADWGLYSALRVNEDFDSKREYKRLENESLAQQIGISSLVQKEQEAAQQSYSEYMDEVSKMDVLPQSKKSVMKLIKEKQEPIVQRLAEFSGDYEKFMYAGGHELLTQFKNDVAESDVVKNAMLSKLSYVRGITAEDDPNLWTRPVNVEGRDANGQPMLYENIPWKKAQELFDDGLVDVLPYAGSIKAPQMSKYFEFMKKNLKDANSPYTAQLMTPSDYQMFADMDYPNDPWVGQALSSQVQTMYQDPANYQYWHALKRPKSTTGVGNYKGITSSNYVDMFAQMLNIQPDSGFKTDTWVSYDQFGNVSEDHPKDADRNPLPIQMNWNSAPIPADLLNSTLDLLGATIYERGDEKIPFVTFPQGTLLVNPYTGDKVPLSTQHHFSGGTDFTGGNDAEDGIPLSNLINQVFVGNSQDMSGVRLKQGIYISGRFHVPETYGENSGVTTDRSFFRPDKVQGRYEGGFTDGQKSWSTEGTMNWMIEIPDNNATRLGLFNNLKWKGYNSLGVSGNLYNPGIVQQDYTDVQDAINDLINNNYNPDEIMQFLDQAIQSGMYTSSQIQSMQNIASQMTK